MTYLQVFQKQKKEGNQIVIAFNNQEIIYVTHIKLDYSEIKSIEKEDPEFTVSVLCFWSSILAMCSLCLSRISSPAVLCCYAWRGLSKPFKNM